MTLTSLRRKKLSDASGFGHLPVLRGSPFSIGYSERSGSVAARNFLAAPVVVRSEAFWREVQISQKLCERRSL